MLHDDFLIEANKKQTWSVDILQQQNHSQQIGTDGCHLVPGLHYMLEAKEPRIGKQELM